MFMPQIIPIRDLKKTSEISELCRKAKQPIFITKRGGSLFSTGKLSFLACLFPHQAAFSRFCS
jgi:hypothetical protein